VPRTGKPRGRKPLPRHLKRERIKHDLPEQEKHCAQCDQGLRRIGKEVGERYEYLPAQMKVIEDAGFTYACACRVKTATKPAQPIEKSTAGLRPPCATNTSTAMSGWSCEGDEGRSLGRRSGSGFKPPRAAVVKSDGGERRGKRWDKIPSGKVQGDERKQTVGELPK
jgi:zinc-finger binding domain of transposase IS66